MKTKPDLALVLEHYGLNIIHKHGWSPCKCVVHEDSHASAAYNLDKQVYNCLVCNLLGDVYDVVAAKEGVDFTTYEGFADRFARKFGASLGSSMNESLKSVILNQKLIIK